jgi:chaperonin GroES
MAKLKLIPLADRVVVTPITEKKLSSGIIIPDTANKERPERGTVVAVGKGRLNDNGQRIAPEISVGDEVVFAKYGPEQITVEGVDYFILREDQILAVIK